MIRVGAQLKHGELPEEVAFARLLLPDCFYQVVFYQVGGNLSLGWFFFLFRRLLAWPRHNSTVFCEHNPISS